MSGPMTAQVFGLCEGDLFRETLQNSEVTSSSPCYNYDENSSFTANLSFPSEVDQSEKCPQPQEPNKSFQNDPNENFNASTTTSSSTITTFNNNNNNHSNFSIIFDSQDEFENDISASIDFSTSPPYSGAPYLNINHQDQLGFSSSQAQATKNGLSVSPYPDDPPIHFMGPPLPCVYEQDCLSMIPPFLRPNPSALAPAPAPANSYSFLEPSMGSLYENSGILNGSLLVGSEMQTKHHEYQDQLHVYNPSDTQSISNDNQQVVNSVSTSLSTEISNNLEDSPFKPGKLSAEERKEKIRRYMKKRNERNFSKKIKYACRKTLADSRPRVRGRFAKNDDLGDGHRHVGNCQEEADEFDEVRACVSSLLHYRNF